MNDSFKSGFVAIVGLPNSGKSTLLNSIVGQKIAIISDKPQTTRDKILAVYTTENEQIIFTDTPGVHAPRTKLGEFMNDVVTTTIRDTDVVVLVADATKPIRAGEKRLIDELSDVPTFLVLNKIDLIEKEALLPKIAEYSALHDFEQIIPISAKSHSGVSTLLQELGKLIPEGPMFFDEDTVTDKTEREIAAEIIREKLLWLLDKEIPHGVAIEIEKVEEKEEITRINAVIYCEKPSHKGIIIGKDGSMLKRVGELARGDIEKMLDKKVFLGLWVKIKADWRNNNFMLKSLGFTENDNT